MKKWCLFLSIFTLCTVLFAQPIQAEGAVLGIHILSPSEAPSAKKLLTSDSPDDWHYVTVPLTLNDLNKTDEWQAFFDYAKEQKLIPIVRLTTRFENGAWQVPTKKNIVDLVGFLSKLEWPKEQLPLIVFNEVNHAPEWGNAINPAEYAKILRFSSDWARSEAKDFVVLPAAMDLAANNSTKTMEAFRYLDQMHAADPDIFATVDVWNSHSYPNPAFSGAATEKGQKSISGFVNELAYVKEKSGRELQTYITETGWAENAKTRRNLENYYTYAARHVWSDPRVIAVTPFLLQGAPGPFSAFSFIDQAGEPTRQYTAFQQAMKL